MKDLSAIFKKEAEMILKAGILLSRIIYIGFIFSLLAVLPIHSQSEKVENQEILRQMQNLVSLLQPSAKQKISLAARELEDNVSFASGKVDYYAAAVSAAKAQFGNLPSTDIEELVSLVMFELCKSEEEALKEMMDEMHEMNQAKSRQRELVERLKKQMADLKAEARGSGEKAADAQLRNLPSSDIEDLVSLVMSELMNSGEETLKEMMGEMHEMNQAKSRQREFVERLKKQMADSKKEARGSDEKAAKARFRNLPPSDIEYLVSLVMFEAMNSGEETLKEMMDEMHEMNQAKKKQRELVERVRKQMADLKETARGSDAKATGPALLKKSSGVVKISPEMTVTRRLKIKYPKVPVLPAPKDIESLSASELDEEISNAEDSLNFLGDAASLMNNTLQDQMQKQSQMIQTISNIIVNHYETCKILIQNLK